MNMCDHNDCLYVRDYKPRIVEKINDEGKLVYYAWSPTWKGPHRNTDLEAGNDLADHLKGVMPPVQPMF